MRLVSRILSVVDFAQNNFILKSAIKLVAKNYNSVEKTEDTEEKITNTEAAEFSFDIEDWLQKKSLKIIVNILESASQLCIKTAKISASIEVTIISGLNKLEKSNEPAQNINFDRFISGVSNDTGNDLLDDIDEEKFEDDIDEEKFDDFSKIDVYGVNYICSHGHWFYKSQLFYDGYTLNEFNGSYTDYVAYIDRINYFEYFMEE